MKQKIYVLGLITAMIICTGAVFKVEHWPAAGIMITAGIMILVLIFLPVALTDNYKAKGNRQNRLLYIITWITCFVVFTGMLFKFMHWPFAGLGLLIALPFPYIVFLPVFLIVTSKNKNFNIYNTVFVLLLLALNSVFGCLLALNVSKDQIEDSYNLSRDYKRIETELKQLRVKDPQTAVDIKIDEVLKIVNDYRGKILTQEGLTIEQWNANPGNLWRPEIGGMAANAILNPHGPYPGKELQTSLQNLMDELKENPGNEKLAKSAPLIFDFRENSGDEDPWVNQVLIYCPLVWSLIYLDGLETNLLMIKASAPAIN